MRVPTLAILLAATPLRAQVAAETAPDLSDPERAALEQLEEAHATTFELVDSWFAGRPIQYYDLGRDAARPAILYRVRGGSDVVTTLPGLPGYRAWYQGHRIWYYDLGSVLANTIPLIAFISGFDENGGIPVDGQPTNVSAIPGIPGYSDMWRIQFAQVGEGFEPGSYRDYRRALADARAGRFRLTDPEVVVNCPVMYVDGRPVAR